MTQLIGGQKSLEKPRVRQPPGGVFSNQWFQPAIVTFSDEQPKNGVGAVTAAAGNDSAAAFVTKFASHHKRCMALAKRFTADNPRLKDSAALSQLCRASQEMLEQAKEARTLTEIYIALDESHRDVVRPIITARFKEIARLSRNSWGRFRDSIGIAGTSEPEIVSAQREFAPHAEEFQNALRAFIAMSAQTSDSGDKG